MNNREKVAVVIISYRTSHLMSNLLRSIDEPDVDLKIYILDNGANETTTAELMRLSDARVEILSSKQNLGFTGGINYVLKHAVESNPSLRYFFLLNPDAICTKRLVGGLLKTLKLNKDTAGVSPDIVHLDGRPWYSGALMNGKKGVILNTPSRQKSGQGIWEVDVYSGCACLFDLQKVAAAGMFNEKLFMYYDEADLSIRLKKKGFKILYNANWTVLHDVSYTTRNISHLKAYYMTRNKFFVFGDMMPAWRKAQYISDQMWFYLKHGMFKNAFYHLKGLIDYKKGRSGALVSAS